MYAPDGRVLAVGSETKTERMRHAAYAMGAKEASWWKLALCADLDEGLLDQQDDDQDDENDDEGRTPMFIPPGKSAEDVFTDYLEWMMDWVEKFIVTHHQGGEQLVAKTKGNRLLVLTHPNSWAGAQQAAMRRATVRAGVVPDATRAATMVRFLSEAEASLTYALMSSAMSSWTQAGSSVAIVDAGGGTIDMTAYAIETTEPHLSVKEVCVPQCFLEGSITVDNQAIALIRSKLAGTRWDNDEDLETIMHDFIRTVKHTFSNDRNPCVIKIGTSVDNDESIGLIKGMLVLQGHEVASLFSRSISATVNGLRTIFADYAPGMAKRVALVGGFSESVYLRESVAKALGPGVALAKPDNATAKAVASGAVAWAIDGVVTARVAKLWYGVRCAVTLDARKQSHIDRLKTRIVSADGEVRIPDAFHPLYAKGQEVKAADTVKQSFSMTKALDEKLTGSFDLIIYRGDDTPPEFVDEESDGFAVLCTLEVNLDRLKNALPIQRLESGRRFRQVRFDIHLDISDTELKARWMWDHQAIAHSGEAQTVYLDDLELFTRKAAPSGGRNVPRAVATESLAMREDTRTPSASGVVLQETDLQSVSSLELPSQVVYQGQVSSESIHAEVSDSRDNDTDPESMSVRPSTQARVEKEICPNIIGLVTSETSSAQLPAQHSEVTTVTADLSYLGLDENVAQPDQWRCSKVDGAAPPPYSLEENDVEAER